MTKSKTNRTTIAPTSTAPRRRSRPYSMNAPRPTAKDVDVGERTAKIDPIGTSKQSAHSLPGFPMNPYRTPPSTKASPAELVYGPSQSGKAPTTVFAQFGSKRRDSATPSWPSDSGATSWKSQTRENGDGPRSSKRRRLGGDDNHEDIWEREEDARLLNKAFRTAEDEISVKDAQIAALQQELVAARTGYERKESELRQDLLFRHILARERAAREHERKEISLHRLVGFLKNDHEQHIEKLEEQHRAALDNERTRTQDALAQAIKDKQQAQDRHTATFAHLQNMQSMIEHTTAISKVFESDLMDLQRLDIEEENIRKREKEGEPPAYDALQDIRGYLTPYAANRHQDNGALSLENMKATITSNFMRELAAATRTSLALREHEDRSKTSGAGSHLFHGAMLAFVTACQQLRTLLDQAIEGRLEFTDMHTIQGHDTPSSKLPSLLKGASQSSATRSTSKLPSISDLGLPESSVPMRTTKVCDPTIDAKPSCETHTGVKSSTTTATSTDPSTIIATTECVTDIIYDLCTHIFAALDVREYGSERLCSNRCSRLGVWLRLVDDTLLKALTRRLEAEAVISLKEVGTFCKSTVCIRCNSEHCGGYCTRLHMISFNTTKLKSIRRSFDKMSSPGRVGMYFNTTYQWLKEALENERQIAANAALPPTRQLTPVMSDEEMALAMQNSVLDETQAATQDAIRRNAPYEELHRRLQAMRDRHYPRPERMRPAPMEPDAMPPVPVSASLVATPYAPIPPALQAAETRREVLDTLLRNQARTMAMDNTNSEDVSEPAERAITGDTNMTAAPLPPLPPVMSEHSLRGHFPSARLRERLERLERRGLGPTPRDLEFARLLAVAHDEQMAARHRAAATDTEDDDVEIDDGNISDYVPPARAEASSSGIRTRAQLRRSSRTIPETPQP